MEDDLIIESAQNPRVKNVIKLRKSKNRQQSNQTVVEGFRELSRAFKSEWPLKELYFCPELFLDEGAADFIEEVKATDIPVLQFSASAFRKMSYRDTPDGLLALSPLVGKKLSELKLPENPLLLIAVNIEKPGNLGTILRTADATGVDAVIVCDPKTDINNPNVIRASIGTLFFIPVAASGTEETLKWLEENKIQSVAAVPDAPALYTDTSLHQGTAIVVGSEDEGLSERWIEESSTQVHIPMLGRNDSLNVSTAAAILLYEAIRQRQ